MSKLSASLIEEYFAIHLPYRTRILLAHYRMTRTAWHGDQTLALLRRAIEGREQPLGYGMLSSALGRLRHPEEGIKAVDGKRKDPMRLQRLRIPIGLIRLCLNDRQRKEYRK
jgi:hypothetical protein